MQPLEEKDSSPLEDAEITRLINVSKQLGYKKQDKIPERNLVDFKPTSIMQIAISSNEKNQTNLSSESNIPQEIKQKKSESEIKESLDESASKDVNNPSSNEIESSHYNKKEQNEHVEPTESSAKKSQGIPDEATELEKVTSDEYTKDKQPETEVDQESLGDMKPVEEPHVDVNKSDGKNIEEAKTEGIEIGKKIALSDLQNEQQRIIETFQAIIDNIQRKEAVDKTNLTQTILKAITRLASERAGSAIEDNPEPFRKKIISFVEKIEQASKKLILNLNPIDANLIKKSLIENLDHKEIEIRDNSELFRGDFILQMGSVEIGDLISEQISINEEDDETTMEAAENPMVTDTESSKKMNSDPLLPTMENQNNNKLEDKENEK